MFEELRAKLDSIDAVLNEDDMDKRNAVNKSRGFDPSKDYTPEELKQYITTIEILKKSGGEARYLLLEVKLESESSQFAKLYLRGFEVLINAHPYLANEFLKRELKPVTTPPFELPEEWPYEREGIEEHYDQAITRKFWDYILTVSAVGGGKFDLKNNAINLRGKSEAFGSVPQAYQGRLREFLEQLVQRPAYNGFQVNFG